MAGKIDGEGAKALAAELAAEGDERLCESGNRPWMRSALPFALRPGPAIRG